MAKGDIGLIGLAVMGENLVMNMESKGYSVTVYNRSKEKVTAFLEGRAHGKKIHGSYSIEELTENLKTPRKIMIMVKSGQPVDEVIEQLIPYLNEGDIIIDGGNSHFQDTIRRTKYLEAEGFLYIGAGVSGGEEGALKGPSIMPGGSKKAWPSIKPIFQAISATANDDTPCCDWIGADGSGHFVKMVHNGIEYGDMQLICEVYQLMKELLGMKADDLQELFKKWNKRELNSYLIEITARILAFNDDDGIPMVDKILDTAGQKGTGKWSTVESLNLGVPFSIISEAVYARCIAARKQERVIASKLLPGVQYEFDGDKSVFIEDVEKALYMAKILSYAQGFKFMDVAAKTYGWKLNLGNIAMLWRGGCIIRSAFLEKVKNAYEKKPTLSNLLLDPFFNNEIRKCHQSLRNVLSVAMLGGISVPALSSALAFYDGYRCEYSPSNLLQAQRDYFGAHTYERIDSPRGTFFHTNWTGEGGNTSSTNYSV